MYDISLGVIIVLITAFGYLSNFLNWRYLNFGLVRFLYYIGALVHEMSHAILCVLTGAKIEKFKVFSSQPQVVHERSKVPLLGEPLISFAPIAGGLLFLFLINRYALGNYFAVPALPSGLTLTQFSHWQGWQIFLTVPLKLFAQLNLLQWQSWVMILLFFNVGAMLGPSFRDLKNVWVVLIILFFIHVTFLTSLGLFALSLIIVNIILQLIVILVLKAVQFEER
jgi:hypothetical protein